VADIPGHPERKVSPEALEAARRIRLEPSERQFLDFPRAAVFSPVPYLPQTIGIALGRVLGANPLWLVYLARLSNLVVATLLVSWSIRQMPALKWTAAFVALLPMAVFLRASVSADALTLALAFALISLLARVASEHHEQWSRRSTVLLCGFSAAVCLTKLPFALLPLAVLAISRHRFPTEQRARVIGAVATSSTLAAALSIAFAASVHAPLRPDAGVDAASQLAFSAAHPIESLGAIGLDLLQHAPRYAAESVGRLGWLDTPLPLWLLVLMALSLALVPFLDHTHVPVPSHAAWAFPALLLIGSTLLIVFSQYVIWTPVAAPFVEGTQGRHFHPLAPLALWILSLVPRRSLARQTWAPALTMALTTFALVVTLVVVAGRYYG
jgi:uncharacterized membrane protein